ncbi:hypothetical protein H0S70_13055 [Chryseobacterium manosquense]|uniref:Uncharacterized protein n=1 Tax=Chryseobacterium manosquense TaxID=2754694 RepID=A0A7H1DW80_9FLAO|nr:hypothetical protein [Chryseobacterium manosquense]QNS41238.1 hypothetical protein H0S70_13055 [Chryseobacterium manosquense]
MKEQLPEVILFQADEKARGYEYQLPPNKQLPKTIKVKSFDYDLADFLKKFTLVGGRPSQNSVYFLHPYKNNIYVSDNLDASYFLKEKIHLFKKVGQLLGAKSIKTKVKESQSEVNTFAGKIEALYKLIKGSGEIKSETTKIDKTSLEISDTYELQDNFDLNKNIDNLRKLIRENNLNHELELISLIDARDSRTSGTKISKRHVNSELSSEYNHLLETSMAIQNPVFDVSAKFNKHTNRLNVLSIDITYEF